MTITFRSLIGDRPKVRITTGELGALLADKERPSDEVIASLGERWADDQAAGYEASRRFIEFWTRDPIRSDQRRIAEPGALGHGAAAIGYELATMAIHGHVTSVVGGNVFTVDDGSGPVDVEVPDLEDRTRMVKLMCSPTPVLVIADMGAREHSVVARRVFERGLFPVPAELVERFATGDVDLVWGGLPHEPADVASLFGSWTTLAGWPKGLPMRSEETGKLVIVRGRIRDRHYSPLVIEDVAMSQRAVAVLGVRAIPDDPIVVVTGHVVLLGPEAMSRSIPSYIAIRAISVKAWRPAPGADESEPESAEPESAEPEGIAALVVHSWHDFHLMRRVRVVAAQSGDYPGDDRLIVEVRTRRDAMGGECWSPPADVATEARLLAEAALRLQLKTKE